MIFHIAQFFVHQWHVLNVLHYVSVRAIAGLLTTLSISWIFGEWFITTSKQYFRSAAREFTPERHQLLKNDMPTMGGLFILANITLSMLLWCNLYDVKIWLILGCMLGFGMIGAWDDWCKIKHRKGFSARTKFVSQVSVGLLFVYAWLYATGWNTTIIIPFFKTVQPDLGLWFVGWALFVLIGTSNAVNLTDGLDGLAIGSLIPTFMTFSIIAYCAGHFLLAIYLGIPFAATAELAIVGAILVGASMGFLWYNTYPAQIFMGDVGSLSLGAALACMALMTKQELLLPLAGGLFVLETLSVIAQVLSFKLYGKRLFKMAPLHHHFELIGWQESKITVRFGIISVVLCLMTLMTLKLR